MTTKPNPIPAGYQTLTPYLTFNGAAKAIDFYKKAFGATEKMRMEHEGKIGHAEIQIGNSAVMIADACAGRVAASTSGSPANLYMYVEDVDAFVAKAVQAGAKLERPVENQFYGDRSGMVVDPFGFTWNVATHVEDVLPDEIRKRSVKFFAEMMS